MTTPAFTSAWVSVYVAVQVVDAPTARVVAGQETAATLVSVTDTGFSATLPVLVTRKLYGTVEPAVVPDGVPWDLTMVMAGWIGALLNVQTTPPPAAPRLGIVNVPVLPDPLAMVATRGADALPGGGVVREDRRSRRRLGDRVGRAAEAEDRTRDLGRSLVLQTRLRARGRSGVARGDAATGDREQELVARRETAGRDGLLELDRAGHGAGRHVAEVRGGGAEGGRADLGAARGVHLGDRVGEVGAVQVAVGSEGQRTGGRDVAGRLVHERRRDGRRAHSSRRGRGGAPQLAGGHAGLRVGREVHDAVGVERDVGDVVAPAAVPAPVPTGKLPIWPIIVLVVVL